MLPQQTTFHLYFTPAKVKVLPPCTSHLRRAWQAGIKGPARTAATLKTHRNLPGRGRARRTGTE